MRNREKIGRRPWDGGYIHRQRDGRDLFIIERQVGKKRFHVSTRAHNYTAAHEQLKRFEADPWGYEEEMREGRRGSDGLHLTDELVAEFGNWLVSRDNPTTGKYRREMENRLADWSEDLGGRDIRRLDLGLLEKVLDARGTSRQHRIIALKSFCSWLRQKRHLLGRKDDVTLDLAVPQAVPEKHRRRKAVPAKSVRKVIAKLAPAYRDCLIILSHAGWHVSELERFIRNPESNIAAGRGDVLAVLQVRHKTGETTRTPVMSQAVLEAARRAHERREVPRRLNDAVKAACRAVGVVEFTPGVMRHSVATWAIEAGTPPEVVAKFLNHKDQRTTERFYVDVAVPTLPVKLPRLI